MDSIHKIYLQRAENELKLAQIIQKLSDDQQLQAQTFDVKPDTYYSAAIAHSYYSIFYAAKAYLMQKGITTKAPDEHKKTYEEFEVLVQEGRVDVELLTLYQSVMIKADTLLDIFHREKNKRGQFTYRTIPQANQEPASGIFLRSAIADITIFLLFARQTSLRNGGNAVGVTDALGCPPVALFT